MSRANPIVFLTLHLKVLASSSPGTTPLLGSRRSSDHSEHSSISGAYSRSILSGEGEKQPIIEGNLQIQGGYECGEKVINVLHTPDGNAVSKFLVFLKIRDRE